MREKFQWWKLITGFLLFLFFHQSYAILGGGILGAILGEGIEAIYPHMKMYFYSYLAISGIEFFLRRKQIASPRSWWTAHALIASSFPWMSIAIWFIPEALGFDMGNFGLAYSLLLTAIGFYFAFRLDEGLEKVEFRPAAQTMIWLAFLGAVITYIGFSFHVPDNFFSVIE
jgi:hypothetical protein